MTVVSVPPYVQCVMESATVSMVVTKQTAVSVLHGGVNRTVSIVTED